MDLIFYHGHCPDGWCAAHIASKKYPEAKLIPLDHGLDPNTIGGIIMSTANKDVLMVDFSLRTREENDAIAAQAKSFRILDHHKTAQAVLEGAPYAIFDMKRSGAGLTWDYLFGVDAPWGQGQWNSILSTVSNPSAVAQKRPWYVDYVEDRDLWNWKLPNSREICAYLGTLELNKEDWDSLELEDSKEVAHHGLGALAHINHYVREAVKQAQTGKLHGYTTAVLNVPYLNCSEVGNELSKTHDISLTWFERGDGITQFSLRSIGDKDVSAVAKTFGGGGHKNAAGFQMSLDEARDFIDRVLGRDIARVKFLTQEIEKLRSPGGCA